MAGSARFLFCLKGWMNMNERINISTGTPWERMVGYSRAVRVGNIVHVSGTTASDEEGRVIGVGDPYAQAKYIFEKIGRALEAAGASLSDVVRVRMYVTNITEQWQEVGRAHHDIFAAVKPVSTMVEISRLIDPDHLVEIEVEAIINAG